MKGMIEMPQEKIGRDELAQTRGTVLKIADSAWNDEYRVKAKPWWKVWGSAERIAAPRCVIGDRILFRQYAGEMLDVEGEDKFRIINDKDVYAVLETTE